MKILLKFIVFIYLLLSFNAYAQDEEGYLVVMSASSYIVDEIYYLDAWLDYDLPEEAVQALQSGVNLLLEVEVEFLRNRRFWLDAVDATLIQSFNLEYNALLERYIVFNENSGTQSYFITLFSALNYIGRVTELPLIDTSLLQPDSDYDIRIRANLSIESMQSILNLIQFWRDNNIQSSWYRWQLLD